jgi:type IV secretion system protein VirB4
MILGESKADVDTMDAAVKRVWAAAGAKPTTEGRAAQHAYWGQLIGSGANKIRMARLDTEQLACLSTLGGFATGAEKPRWGRYLFDMATTALTRYPLDLFVRGVGHNVIIAPNDAGKTVALGMIITALDDIVCANDGIVCVCDVDQSNANIILALGGTHFPIRYGRPFISPLRWKDAPHVRAMLRHLVSAVVQWDGGAPPNAAQRRGIADGIDFVMSEVPPEQRSFAIVRQFMDFDEGGVGERFEPWCRDGEYGWVIDGDVNSIEFGPGKLIGIDFTEVMNDKTVMPVIAQLVLWMAGEWMDGRRFVMMLEEAPAYLPEPRFNYFGKALALRARKRNTAFIPVAQMPEHLLETEAGKAIIKQAKQFILLPNDKAEREAYCTGMGLTDAAFNAVREGMLKEGGWPLLVYRTDGQSSVNRFDLSAHRNHLAILSSTPVSANLFRSIIEKNGKEDMMRNVEELWARLGEARV